MKYRYEAILQNCAMHVKHLAAILSMLLNF